MERDVARKRGKRPTKIVRDPKTMAGNYQLTRICCFVFLRADERKDNAKSVRKR